MKVSKILMFLFVGLVLSSGVYAATWVADSSLVLGLSDIGFLSSPSLSFNLSGNDRWTLLSGTSNTNIRGFNYSNSLWSEDTTLVSGLFSGFPGPYTVPSPDVIYNLRGDNKWTILFGERFGTFQGYRLDCNPLNATNYFTLTGQTETCSAQSLTFNGTISIRGTHIMNNSQYKLTPGVAGRNITINATGQFIINSNSILNATPVSFTIYAEGRSKFNISNSKAVGSHVLTANGNSSVFSRNSSLVVITIQADANSTITNTTITTPTFTSRSKNKITKSTLTGTTTIDSTAQSIISNSTITTGLFRDASRTILRNVTITTATQIGNSNTLVAILNASRRFSTISAITELRFKSHLIGYFNMPVTVTTYTSPNVNRSYPVQLNYTTGAPYANMNVTIKTKSSSLITQATTNANGFVWLRPPPYTTTTKAYNYTIYGNYNLRRNATISLLSDTLQNIQLSVFDSNSITSSVVSITSVLENATITNSNVSNSTVLLSNVVSTSVVRNSYVDPSKIINSSIDGSSVRNATIDNSMVNQSRITGKLGILSPFYSSVIINNSNLYKTNVTESTLNNVNANNSIIYKTNLSNINLPSGTHIENGSFVNSVIFQYPLHVFGTNIQNVTVNVVNSSGSTTFSKITNATGYILVNVTFSSSNNRSTLMLPSYYPIPGFTSYTFTLNTQNIITANIQIADYQILGGGGASPPTTPTVDISSISTFTSLIALSPQTLNALTTEQLTTLIDTLQLSTSEVIQVFAKMSLAQQQTIVRTLEGGGGGGGTVSNETLKAMKDYITEQTLNATEARLGPSPVDIVKAFQDNVILQYGAIALVAAVLLFTGKPKMRKRKF